MRSKLLSTAIVLLSALLAISSAGGLLFDDMYVRETGDWAAQCVAQDLFDLLIVVPTLLIVLYLYRRNPRRGFFILAGILAFLIYTFIIYALAVHFNRFFILYCFTLALSIYSFIYLLWHTGSEQVKGWFELSRPVTIPIIYLLFFAVLFYLLWLSEIVPAITSGVMPANLQVIGLLTNPVHVIDLSFLLPGFVITAYLLYKRHALGYVLAPIIMTFSVVMTLSIATLLFYEYAKGYVADYTVALAMIFFAIVSRIVFNNFVRTSQKV